VENNEEKLKIAVALQFMLPGSPMLYYGDEVGIKGSSDPDNRRTMLWEETSDNYNQSKELLEFYKKIIKIRKENTVLTQGRANIKSVGENESIIMIKRELKGKSIIGLINTTSKQIEIKFDLKQKEVLDLLSKKNCKVENGVITVILDSYGIYILK